MKISKTKACHKDCINKKFLLQKNILEEAKKILEDNMPVSKVGRKMLDWERMLHGIYYLLRTGCHWNGLPRCFGSSSAVHRFFMKLIRIGFFKLLWTKQLEKYAQQHGIDLKVQSMDSAHRKSPMGKEKVGKSPVDRSKHGTKLSTLSTKGGLTIGLAVGAGNTPDEQLFFETLQSIPPFIQQRQPQYKEMHLDAAYDTENVKIILFNHYYVPKISPNKRRGKIKPKNPLGYCRYFIEPVHSWLNRYRSVFVRYFKYAANYLGISQFAVALNISNKI